MNRLHIFLFLFTTIIGSGFCQEKQMLIISDIDDTIRPTNALDFTEAAPNLLENKAFLGINDLYQRLLCQDSSSNSLYRKCLRSKGQNNNKRILSYITGFPSPYLAKKYLKKTHFPLNGVLHSKPIWEDTYDFKLQAHLETIKQFPAKIILLIGDNGQEDINVFAEIKKRIQISQNSPQVFSYVHQVYDQEDGGKQLIHGQKPYLTFFDLGSQLVRNNLLSQKAFLDLVTKYRHFNFNNNDPLFPLFKPSWVHCSDFYLWYRSEFQSLGSEYEEDEKDFEQFLEKNC